MGEVDLDVPVVGISHHAHFTLDSSDFLLRGRLRTTHSKERHDCGGFEGVLRR